MIKMIILIIAVSFLPLFQCDTNTGLFWIEKEINGRSSTFNMLYGDPEIYFQNFANNVTKSEDYTFDSFTVTSSLLQSIAFDAKNELLAISDIKNGRVIIYELFDILTKSSITSKYTFTDFANITGMAFAGYFNLLYFVGGYPSPYIGALDLTNSHWIKLYDKTIIGEPYSIAIDEKNRYVFWSDLSFIPKIKRSNLYGEEGKVIVNILGSKHSNLVVDAARGRLFWLDGYFLKSSDFDGNDIFTHAFPNGMYSTFVIYKSLAILGASNDNRLDSYDISQTVAKEFGSVRRSNSTAVITAASLDSKEFKTFVSNPCAAKPCVHMCFPKKGTEYFCTCYSGFTLGSDGRTCILIKSSGSMLKGIGFKLLGFSFLAHKTSNLFK